MLMKHPPKLRTLLPMTNGIFGHMNYTFKLDATKDQMDMLLKMQWGERNPSQPVDYVAGYVDWISEGNNPFFFEWKELDDSQLTTLAELILAKYKPKWDKLGEIYSIEYDPIHNYLDEWEDHSIGTDKNVRTDDLTREDTYNTTTTRNNTRTDDLKDTTAETKQNNNTRTDNLSEDVDSTTNVTGSDSNSNNYAGFNSETARLHDSSSGSNSQKTVVDSTTKNTGTQTNIGTETDSGTVEHTGTRSDSGSEKTTGTITRDNTGTVTDNGNDQRDRHGKHMGNIGNLTSQKQILEEIELWKWSYINTILDDAKEFLTLPTYLF